MSEPSKDTGYVTPSMRFDRIEATLRWQNLGILVLLVWHVVGDPAFAAFLRDVRGIL